MAEQLVEVPTLLSVAVLQQRTAEQLASIPVPRGRHGRISERIVEQTFFPSRDEHISERTVEQVVDIPVHGRGVSSRGASRLCPRCPGTVQQRLVVVSSWFSPGTGFNGVFWS